MSTRRGRPKGGGLSPDAAREHILDATEACFSRFGLDKTTVDDIAAEAGFSRSMIYRHFSGRDALLDGVLTRITERYVASVAERFDDEVSLGAFTVAVMTEVVLLARADATLAGMFGGPDQALASQAAAGSEQVKDRARAVVRSILDTAGPERLAELRPGLEPDRVADHLMLIGLALVQGYGPEEPDEVEAYLRDFVLPALVQG